MIQIRNYKKEDFEMVKSWWDAAGEVAPLPDMMPEESSFIAEIDGRPALAISLYLTNTPEICYVENFIGNPDLKGLSRNSASHLLINHIEKFASSLGYKRLICLAHKEQLKNHYQKLGGVKTLDNLASFAKEIVCHQQ